MGGQVDDAGPRSHTLPCRQGGLDCGPLARQSSLPAGTREEGIDEEETHTLISTCVRFSFLYFNLQEQSNLIFGL